MAKNPKRHQLRSRKERIALGLERTVTPRPILPERHLFVTEGTKTEPNYLYGMIDRICQLYGEPCRRQFQVYGEGANTLGLLERAENHLRSASDGFQHVWLLYDLDDFPPDRFDNTVTRCQALNERNRLQEKDTVFHPIWSNQCVELWFLLHFDYLQAGIPREAYRQRLSELLGRPYEKNDPELFSLLLPRLRQAVSNAKMLWDSFPADTPPSQRAPCTAFFQLIESLQSYLQPRRNSARK